MGYNTMSITDIFYTIFIWPIYLLVEFIFLAFKEIFSQNIGLVVIFLSITINIALLPIYSVADRWQNDERTLQKKMSKKLSEIRSVFKGDERQMIINAYYRQMNYSPINALKSSVGLILQIPFFIAAYQFLSHTSALQGVSFLNIRDLSRCDELLIVNGKTINILPILMTFINILSSLVYTHNFKFREKVQLWAFSLVFLILLYNSPAGLLLYWTVNNIFSLGKNIITKIVKHPLKALYLLGIFCSLTVIVVLLSGRTGINRYRYVMMFMCLLVLAVPFLWKGLLYLTILMPTSKRDSFLLYFSSHFLLGLLIGFLIPSQIIAASPFEFTQPGIFIFRTLLQSIVFSGIMASIIWLFANLQLKKLLSWFSASFAFIAAIGYFSFGQLYGTMTRGFKFENANRLLDAFPPMYSFLILLSIIVFTLFFILHKKQTMLFILIQGTIIGTFALGILYTVSIFTELRQNENTISKIKKIEDFSSPEGFHKFTTTGENTVLFFLDRASGVTMNDVLKYKPDLIKKFDGFIWYPNTISFANFTVSGLTAVFGGYDYSVTEINKRKNQNLEDKINEAYSLLPKLFGESGNRVFITDPPIANSRTIPATTFFNNIENVRSVNINDYFVHRYLAESPPPPPEEERSITSFDFDILFRYSVFRIALPVLRYAIYYNGKWWRDGSSNSYERALSNFSTLYYLQDMCSIDEGPNTLNIFMNETTHDDEAFTSALRPISGPIQYKAEEKMFFNETDAISYIYSYVASMEAIVAWFEYLKEHNIYDNTRIIIVSDHGLKIKNSQFQEHGMEMFNPLLLVKDRHMRGDLALSEDFMTNADPVTIATSDFVDPVNPYLGNSLKTKYAKNKNLIVNETPGNLKNQFDSAFNVIRSRELLGDNIFLSQSWGPWIK
jgi:YidC/Oxa1 family membrane protein insertase